MAKRRSRVATPQTEDVSEALQPYDVTVSEGKELNIVIDENTGLYSFGFVGMWTGRDISYIETHVRKAYKESKRNERLKQLGRSIR